MLFKKSHWYQRREHHFVWPESHLHIYNEILMSLNGLTWLLFGNVTLPKSKTDVFGCLEALQGAHDNILQTTMVTWEDLQRISYGHHIDVLEISCVDFM